MTLGSPRPVVGLARTGPRLRLVDRGGLVTAFATNGAPAPRNKLYPGERLNPGEMLTSANGRPAAPKAARRYHNPEHLRQHRGLISGQLSTQLEITTSADASGSGRASISTAFFTASVKIFTK